MRVMVRPELVVRTARGGGVSSPTNTVLLGAAGVASMIAGWLVHPSLLVLSMFLFSFALASAVELTRQKSQKS